MSCGYRSKWRMIIAVNSINWPRSQCVASSSVGRASHRYRGGHGFESRWGLDFFRLLLSNCLHWKIYCDNHSSLWFINFSELLNLFSLFSITMTTIKDFREFDPLNLIDLVTLKNCLYQVDCFQFSNIIHGVNR